MIQQQFLDMYNELPKEVKKVIDNTATNAVKDLSDQGFFTLHGLDFILRAAIVKYIIECREQEEVFKQFSNCSPAIYAKKQ